MEGLKKSTEKANSLEKFFTGWSRTAQGVIALFSALTVIVTGFVSFGGTMKDFITSYSEKHANELMERGVNEISEKVANDVLLVLSPYMINNTIVIDSLISAQRRSNHDVDEIRRQLDRMAVTQWQMWSLVNDEAPPSSQEIESHNLKNIIREMNRRDSIREVEQREHLERLDRASQALEEIKHGDRFQ